MILSMCVDLTFRFSCGFVNAYMIIGPVVITFEHRYTPIMTFFFPVNIYINTIWWWSTFLAMHIYSWVPLNFIQILRIRFNLDPFWLCIYVPPVSLCLRSDYIYMVWCWLFFCLWMYSWASLWLSFITLTYIWIWC